MRLVREGGRRCSWLWRCERRAVLVCVCFMVLGLMGWRLGCDWNIVQGGRGGGGRGDGYDSIASLTQEVQVGYVGR